MEEEKTDEDKNPNMVGSYFVKSDNVWYFTNFSKRHLQSSIKGLVFTGGKKQQTNYYGLFF